MLDRDDPRRIAAETLRLEAAAINVPRALAERGIRSILLKGASLSWLYRDTPRTYGDVDLLVDRRRAAEAGGVLRVLGYEPLFSDDRRDPEKHAQAWIRRDHTAIDLHTSVVGARVDDDEVWTVLTAHGAVIDIGGEPAAALDTAAQLALVALHAAQHGVSEPRPLEDLRRAIESADEAMWRAAAEVAAALGAIDAFTAGLALQPAGVELAAGLALAAPTDIEVRLRAASLPTAAVKIDDLRHARGVARVRVVIREAFPGRAYLRRSSALARRGHVGLAIAFAMRPFLLPGRYLMARRAWRAVSEPTGGDRAPAPPAP